MPTPRKDNVETIFSGGRVQKPFLDTDAGGLPGFVGDLRRNTAGVADLSGAMLAGLVNESIQGVRGVADMTGLSKLGDVRAPILNINQDVIMRPEGVPQIPFELGEEGQVKAEQLAGLVNSVMEMKVGKRTVGDQLDSVKSAIRGAEPGMSEALGVPAAAAVYAVVNSVLEVGGPTKGAGRTARAIDLDLGDAAKLDAPDTEFDFVATTMKHDTGAPAAAMREVDDLPPQLTPEQQTSQLIVDSAGEPIAPTVPLEHTEIISTRRPTAVKATESPDSEYLRIDLDSAKRDPRSFKHNVGVVTQYPNYRPRQGVTSPNGRAEVFIEDAVDNLLFIHDAIDPQIRGRSQQWYDGTSVIVDRFGEAYPGQSRRQLSGVVASLSPQKDWFMNASLAERVLQTKSMFGAHRFDDAMATVAERLTLNNAAKSRIRNITNKSLEEITDPVEQAWFVRLFDEAHNPRSYSVISPEGDFIGLNRNLDGSASRVAWGSSDATAKAISIMDDGSIENISRMLGDQHKVRSFNNNINDPNNPLGDVTIDTHAVAAALMRPLSGSSKEVIQAFGGTGSASNSVLGVNGTYPLYAEAYRRAAARRGDDSRRAFRVPSRSYGGVAWRSWRSAAASRCASGRGRRGPSMGKRNARR